MLDADHLIYVKWPRIRANKRNKLRQKMRIPDENKAYSIRQSYERVFLK